MTRTKLPRLLLMFAVFVLPFTGLMQGQTYTDIHDFDEIEGCCALYPSMMVQGRDGNIYGATTSGGSHFYGNIFKMTPSGTLTSIYSFDSTHGNGPVGGITLGTDGNFYGTTYQGGSGHAGTIFKVTPSGTFTELYDFTNGSDGAYPRVPPAQAQDGNFYGVTGNGTTPVLYQWTTAGVFTPMATLPAQSYSPLLLGLDGYLYGTTVNGGTHNGGTVFQFQPSTKTLKIIFNFNTEYSPYGPLMQGPDGVLYGTTSVGGTGGGGVVFKMTTGGSYKVLVNFNTTTKTGGTKPYSGVVLGSDKYLYGVTSTGGANGQGVLFKVSTTGSGFKVLHDFATVTGDTPYSTPLLHTSGTIYGMAFHGGAHTAYGTVYSLDAGLSPFVAPVVRRSAKVGTSIGVIGQGFHSATGVLFGAGAGTYTVSNDTYLTAKIVAGATTGPITVEEPSGNLLSPLNFRVSASVTGFSPSSGAVGSQVVITGVSLLQATAVKFGGVVATTFTVNSDTQITATVPTGAKTGKISVITPGGTANSSTTFTVN